MTRPQSKISEDQRGKLGRREEAVFIQRLVKCLKCDVVVLFACADPERFSEGV